MNEDGSKTEINLGKHTRTEVKRVKPAADVETSAEGKSTSTLPLFFTYCTAQQCKPIEVNDSLEM